LKPELEQESPERTLSQTTPPDENVSDTTTEYITYYKPSARKSKKKSYDESSLLFTTNRAIAAMAFRKHLRMQSILLFSLKSEAVITDRLPRKTIRSCEQSNYSQIISAIFSSLIVVGYNGIDDLDERDGTLCMMYNASCSLFVNLSSQRTGCSTTVPHMEVFG